MMKKLFLLLISVLLWSNLIYGENWKEDILGDNYEMRYVNQPDDYTGKVRCTIVRKMAVVDTCRAILYVHGFNDYFFQKEMGDLFVDSCYNFYALDLRKYGRSYMDNQKRFEIRDYSEYFADIDSVMTQIVKDGNKKIFLMGHSNGGLVTSYYLAKGMGKKFPVEGLMLNSPFMDMNLGCFTENFLLPVVGWISNLFPSISFTQEESTGYAESLLKEYNGEWSYNTDWKLKVSPAVTSGWLGAVYKAQSFIQDGVEVGVPVLLMYSDKTVSGIEWTPDFNKADVVLDVKDIAKYGSRLGKDVESVEIKDGIHDLVLSRKDVREAVYKKIFQWMNTH